MTRPHDLRLRLLGSLVALILFTPVRGLAPAGAGLVLVLMLYAIHRQAIPWKRLLHLEGFLILLLITLPFTIPGGELLRLGPFVATVEGLARALVLACKVTASVLLVSLMFASADVPSLGAALRGLHVPEALVRLFVAVVRYLALIQSEFLRLRESMRARAFVPRSSRHTWRSYGYLLGMLLVRAMERADRVEEAMRLRCYSGRFPQSELPAPAMRDWFAMMGLMAGAALLLAWDTIWMN
ncbi:cobalt ECF transporter T component CbiQ [Castellaniella sp.]|uniref:cobalt ECF transporter T component CbiQ n=1 Tax=Castellaniella sp. TaxID=1955812 RepID=UPI00355CE382